MKNQKVWVALAVAVGAVALSGTVWAATNTKDITVTYGIDVAVDGIVAQFEDGNGDTVYPFVYEGTTYVPIRGAAESVGATVDYDADLNMAVITSPTSDQTGYIDASVVLNGLTFMGNYNTIQRYSQAIDNIYNTMYSTYLKSYIMDYSLYSDDFDSIESYLDVLEWGLEALEESLLEQAEIYGDNFSVTSAIEGLDQLYYAMEEMSDAVTYLELFTISNSQTYYELYATKSENALEAMRSAEIYASLYYSMLNNSLKELATS